MKDKITIQQLLDLASSVEEEYDRTREMQDKVREIFEIDFRYEFICMHEPNKTLINISDKKAKKEKPKNPRVPSPALSQHPDCTVQKKASK